MFAQDLFIEGSISDLDSGQAIPYATIEVLDDYLCNYSNNNGDFRLVFPDSSYLDKEIKFSAPNYESQKYDAKSLMKVANRIQLKNKYPLYKQDLSNLNQNQLEFILAGVIDRLEENYLSNGLYRTFSRQYILLRDRTDMFSEEITESVVEDFSKTKTGLIKIRGKFYSREYEGSFIYLESENIFPVSTLPLDEDLLKTNGSKSLEIADTLLDLLNGVDTSSFLSGKKYEVNQTYDYNNYEFFDLYNFQITGNALFDEDTVLVIAYQPINEKKKHLLLPNGVLYVNLSDMSIVSHIQKASNKDLSKRTMNKVDQFLSGNYNYQYEISQVEKNYRKVNKKYVLGNVMKYEKYTEHDFSSNRKYYFREYKQSFILNVNNSDLNFSYEVMDVLNNNLVNMINEFSSSMYDGFWEDYNYIILSNEIKRR